MDLTEARAECERWLAHLVRQKEDAVAMGRIASDRRAGRCTLDEAKERVYDIDKRKGLAVYDGANLAEAVALLLKHTR